MLTLRPKPLSIQLALASLVSVVALTAVCGVGVLALNRLSANNSTALRGQMDLFDNTAALESLIYQKGFISDYMLTLDRAWLSELDHSRQAFARWLETERAAIANGTGDAAAQRLLSRIIDEYRTYDDARAQIIATFDAGRLDEATRLMQQNHAHAERLLALCQDYCRLGHHYAQEELNLAHRSMQDLTGLLLLASVGGILASLAMGFFLARRIDAAILEQRQRLIQSEKMSAIGEVAAKLAHEILNPLAGMKAAAQLLLRGAPAPAELRETATALDREITRIDQLVHRLVNYARPLAPRPEVLAPSHLLEAVAEATRRELSRAGVALLRDEAPNLPALDGDPLLLTQALTNLVVNAVQASPSGGRVILSAQRESHHLRVQVLDEGPGISAEQQPRLFHPFFTTKPAGHGLGLAITQNIVLEHGGQITARNRDDGPGALFEVLLPLGRSVMASAAALRIRSGMP